MKIIDDRGKLFGKINVIDFASILFLLSLVPMFYFGYKILTDKPRVITRGKVFIETEIDCQLIKIKPELVNIISIGDKELNENGETIGEIVSLGKSMLYKYEFDIGQNQKIIKEDPILKQIEARLRLKVEVKKEKPFYKDREIRIGSPLEFKANNFAITAIPTEEEKVRIVDLYVTLKDLDEDTLRKISVGDKEVDESGKTIAEILSLGKIEDLSIEFDFGAGNYVIKEDSTKKQISAKMRLICQVKGGSQIYFRGVKVEENAPFEFKTDKYKVVGLVALKEKWISLRVKFSRLVPEIARVIQEGDIEQDAYRRTIAKINSIISNKPSLVEDIYEGKFITINHPFDRDIVASLDVLCVEKEGVYYFKYYLAKIGNNIKFNTDSYSISGLIVGIEEK